MLVRHKAWLAGSLFLLALVGLISVGFQPAQASDPLDRILRSRLLELNITVPEPGAPASPAQVELGRMLYFDKLLSGNRDVSCATCHHPTLATGDARPLSVGTAGVGLGPDRQRGQDRPHIPRNAPDVFNRGSALWTTMFWDMRIEQMPDGRLLTPAGAFLPEGIDDVLAAQALFPPTAEHEMRGMPGDRDLFGHPNELAEIPAQDFPAIWNAIVARLQRTPPYRPLFEDAYPGTRFEEITIVHVANAIAAFEREAFTLLNSPWDRYLRGDDSALSPAAKRGALLFYGELGCSACHSGPLMTDQQAHNIAVPQLGPGKGASAPFDFGRELVSGSPTDRYAFRTPPLRNVAVTGPYMHNGAFRTLKAAVRHHLNPAESLRTYTPSAHLPADLVATYQDDPALQEALLDTLDRNLHPTTISDDEFADLLAFLHALTDPAVYSLAQEIPTWVPSGLPVAEIETRTP
ncbi:MAG: cytochrome-c peroxidase [Ardenticatenia bacterium]|nr:MAG: cytochrome-c peroxidase [Ardenticatenia bacterium]